MANAYEAAVPVSRTFSVSKAGQKITFAPLTKKTLTGSSFARRATASSGLAVSFTALPPSVCTTRTIGGRAKITLLKAGTCTVRASQAGSATYDPATPVSRSFKVSAGS